jgi:hypothetical protein
MTNATHLLNIEEGIHSFGCKRKDSYLIVFGNSKVVWKQMMSRIDRSEWKKVIIFYKPAYFLFDGIGIPKRYTRIYKRMVYFYAFNNLMREVKGWGRIEKYFAVNILSKDVYLRRLMNELAYEQMIFYDDGASTIELVDKINELAQEGTEFIKINEVTLPEKIIFFSVYRLKLFRPQDQLVINSFDVQKSRIIKSVSDQNTIFFLGTPLGRYYMDFEDYLKTLARIKIYFLGSRLLYIPHRAETELELDSIGKVVELFFSDRPIEQLLIEGKVFRPRILASFISSGLANISSIYSDYPDLSVKAFYLKDEIIDEHKGLIEAIYNSFETLDKNLIEIVRDY